MLPLVTDTLSAFDETYKRCAQFIVSCVDRGSALVRSIVRYGLTVARYNHFIDSSALFCCGRYRWSTTFYAIILIYLILLLPTPIIIWLMIKWNKLRCLCTTLCIREEVFEFCQDRNFLSRSQVIWRHYCLACEWSYVVYCTLLTAHFTLAQCTLSRSLLKFYYLYFFVLSVRFSIINKSAHSNLGTGPRR